MPRTTNIRKVLPKRRIFVYSTVMPNFKTERKNDTFN